MNRLTRFGVVAVIAIAVVNVPNPAHAEDYPNKPIRLIVATAAGGLMDVAARVLADRHFRYCVWALCDSRF